MAISNDKWNGAFVRTDKLEGEGGLFGSNRPSMVYLQFVTATVYANVVNEQSPYIHNMDTGEVSEANINTIFAVPHEGIENLTNESQIFQEKFRFKPLLRGISEIPTRGDQVLCCHMGNVNYFLGPLNADNNPNYNEDTIGIKLQPAKHGNVKTQSEREIQDKNFDRIPLSRLIKKSILSIDADNGKTTLINPKTNLEYLSTQHGDMILEGRHGNSIRFGSRGTDTMTYLSNARNPRNNTESWMDSSIIAMTTNGTLEVLLGGMERELKSPLNFANAEDGTNSPELEPFPYNVYSDIDNQSDRKISDTMKVIFDNLDESPTLASDPSIYTKQYGGPQLYIGSEGRTTLNSKNGVLISSNTAVNIGTQNYLTFSVGKDTILDSTNIYLGKAAVKDKNPLVLGNELVGILKDMVKVIKGAASNFYSSPLPLTDSNLVPLSSAAGPGTLVDIEGRLNTILSEFHFIENNTGEEKIDVGEPPTLPTV